MVAIKKDIFDTTWGRLALIFGMFVAQLSIFIFLLGYTYVWDYFVCLHVRQLRLSCVPDGNIIFSYVYIIGTLVIIAVFTVSYMYVFARLIDTKAAEKHKIE
jgi:hypothetical protein